MSFDSKTLRTLWIELRRTLPLSAEGEALRPLLDTITVSDLCDGRLILHAPSRFARDKVASHLRGLLLEAWQQRCPQVCVVDIVVGRRHALPEVPSAQMPSFPGWEAPKPIAVPTFRAPARPLVADEEFAVPMSATAASWQEIFSLTPTDDKYSFDNFVMGESNRAALNAMRQLVSLPHAPFNPLFLHGVSGVGKTHLMHAAVLHMMQHAPERRVLYLSAEQFMYRFVRALRRRDMESFKDEVRSLDVLLLDDVQFLSGKDSVQEEFFHTFNALIEQGKYLILSADRVPHRIDDLALRIQSRLNAGLTIEVLPPEYDLRLRLLRFKAQRLQREYPALAQVSPQVFELIASRITANVRDLEGALHRIAARTALGNTNISLDDVRALLSDMIYSTPATVQPDEIMRQVASRYNVTVAQILSDTRLREVVEARNAAMMLLRDVLGLSYNDIGRMLGSRAHTTVLHGLRKLEQSMAQDGGLRQRSNDLRQYFGLPAISAPHKGIIV